MNKYVFCSFRDADTNTNLGCCIVKAQSVKEGHQKTARLGINPGGEVAMWELDQEQFDAQGLELDRLYTNEEMSSKNFKRVTDP